MLIRIVAIFGLYWSSAFAKPNEIDLARQTGELRRACSKYGRPLQPASRNNTSGRLANLRYVMSSEVILGTFPIDAYLVTSNDEHQSTETEDYEKRREFITGFNGTIGNAIITTKKAALWTDGRFHLQADADIDCNWLLFREGKPNIPTMSEWLQQEFPSGGRIGLNPKLVSEYTWQKMSSELSGSNFNLISLNVSLIDLIWPGELRKEKLSQDAFVLDVEYSGKTYITKIEETRKELRKHGADAMVVTALDEIAWLLNIRGRDVPCSPFLRSYVILDMANIFLYANASQLTNRSVLETLQLEPGFRQKYAVKLKPYSDIWKDLRIKSQVYKKMLIPSRCVYSEGASHAIYETISENQRFFHQSPIIYLKARKNPVEEKGMEIANIKDAAAVCDCFGYVTQTIIQGKNYSEMDVVGLLNRYRYEQKFSLGNSFTTIVAYGKNAALPNYIPSWVTNAEIFTNNTLVLDSGGQYLEGTTDVTRTLHFGEPTDDMKEAYTRVLKGIISLSTLTFPSDVKIAMVDVMARASLWEIGLDYLHESGHGVGAFLSVHESPIQVRFDSDTSMTQVFKPGYFLSIEPGHYSEYDFGVRLENVLEVVEKPQLSNEKRKFLGFKVFTVVPFEPNLMKFTLLSHIERRWLNNYNEEIRRKVGPELKKQNRKLGYEWMMSKTEHIPEGYED